MNGGDKEFLGLLTAAGKPIVGERGVGADKHIIAHTQTVPQLHTALDGNAVAQNDVVLNQAVRADVAVLPDLGAGQCDDKLPKARARTDGSGLNI